jgi:hypothetical protein
MKSAAVTAITVFLACLCGIHNSAFSQRVVINEFMASNGSTIADEDWDFEDWVELYNSGTESVDLAGWGLSDNDGDPFKWRFPEGTTISAKGYLLVWASGKNHNPEEPLAGLIREVWTGISGVNVSDLTSHPDYPAKPTTSNRLTDYFEAPINIDDNYGQRVHGILTPPLTGYYRFWIASDDYGQLHLSTDQNPDNAVLIASVPGWTEPRQWNKYESQQSALIPLVAGQSYYIAALMKEGGGNDSLTVRWQRPDGTLQEPMPAQYIVSPRPAQLHTNFRIASAGEPLLLTRPDGQTEDYVAPIFVPRDITYGRMPDGGDVWHYFSDATPVTANVSTPVFLPPTVTPSEPRGFKTAPFHVTLTASAPSAVIRYTLDGSEPGPTSSVYTQPLYITQTTTLRAYAGEPGMIQLPPTTVTYLFLDDVLQQNATPPPGWPANRQINNHAMEYGLSATIVANDNNRLREGMAAIPSISLVTDLNHLFHPADGVYSNSGNYNLECPVSVELIDPIHGQTAEFQIDAGLRLRGAFSRSVDNPKHSFRLLFRSAYGENRLYFPLFDDEGASEYHKVDLRTAQNYSWAFQNDSRNTFVREVFSRDSQRDMGMPYTRSRYYHLYLNGQYWGLYMTQERGDSDWAATYLAGESDDWDCIKTSQPGYSTQASDGTFEAFYTLHDLAVNQGFNGANADNYWRAQGLNPDGTPNPDYPAYLHQDNLINYMIVAHYTGDPDSPVSIWGGFPNNMYGLFNRLNPNGFTWLRHDAEHSLGAHPDYGVYADTTGAGAGFTDQTRFNPSILHWRLMDHPDYRMRFADLVQRHLYNDGILTPENAKARVQSRMAEIDLAIIGESARWGRGKTRDETWIPACNAVLSYLDQRRDIIVDHYRNRGWFPDVNAPRFALANEKIRISAETPFYYMIDGSDPRLPGGGIHAQAIRVDHNSQSGPLTLVSRGAAWQYFDAGTEPPMVAGRTWIDPDYPDDNWSGGPAILGFAGSTPTNPVSTVTKRWVSGTSGPQVNTTYFRHTFNVEAPEEFIRFDMEILRDDGAIIYLNGVELLRENMPMNPVTYDTQASAVVGGTDQTTYFIRLSDAVHLLRPGVNVLAAEVHQIGATSSDLYFDFSLSGERHPYYVDLPLHLGIALRARAYHDGQWSALAETSTLSELPEGTAIHQWDFENEINYLNPSYTWGGGALTVQIPPESPAEIERSAAAQDFETAHLRINDPLDAVLYLNLPTTGAEQIRIEYLTRRSGQGAGQQTIEYTTNGTDWTMLHTYSVEDAAPQLWAFSLANVEAANNNPAFAVRITFSRTAEQISADPPGGLAGNNRFDNIVIKGLPMPGTNLPPQMTAPMLLVRAIEHQPTAIDLSAHFTDPDGDVLSYSAEADKPFVIETAITNGTLTLTPLYRGDAVITLTVDDGLHTPLQTTFRVLVYPAARTLRLEAFRFDHWSPDNPECTFPDGMLFLQSRTDDPGLTETLDDAYFIPHDDYPPDEQDKIGYPYSTTARTRLSGLLDGGIGLINTGRDRDLGGALAAVDTTGLDAVRLRWLGGTMLANYRRYAIRLQYRIGTEGDFADVLHNGQPVEYLVNTDGHTEPFGPIDLPPEAIDQPYVQLLWRYYHVDGISGARAQLRLDEIAVSGVLGVFEDFSLFAQWWLTSDCGLYDHCGQADLNRDARVDLQDFAILAAQWIQGN